MDVLAYPEIQTRLNEAVEGAARAAEGAKKTAGALWDKAIAAEEKVPGWVLIVGGLGLTVASDGLASTAGGRLALAGAARIVAARGGEKMAARGGWAGKAGAAAGAAVGLKAGAAAKGAAEALSAAGGLAGKVLSRAKKAAAESESGRTSKPNSR